MRLSEVTREQKSTALRTLRKFKAAIDDAIHAIERDDQDKLDEAMNDLETLEEL